MLKNGYKHKVTERRGILIVYIPQQYTPRRRKKAQCPVVVLSRHLGCSSPKMFWIVRILEMGREGGRKKSHMHSGTTCAVPPKILSPRRQTFFLLSGHNLEEEFQQRLSSRLMLPPVYCNVKAICRQ